VIVLADFLVLLQSMMVWQVWAQPFFDTLESLVKASRIRRQLNKVGAAGSQQDESSKLASAPHADSHPAAPRDGNMPPSPFNAMVSFAQSHTGTKLTALSEDEEAAGLEASPSPSLTVPLPELIGSCRSSAMRQRRMSVRGSGAERVFNSGPVPDILPPQGTDFSKTPLAYHATFMMSYCSTVSSGLQAGK
jgi:hypothetical protein